MYNYIYTVEPRQYDQPLDVAKWSDYRGGLFS